MVPDEDAANKLSTIDEDAVNVESTNAKQTTKTSKFNLIKAMQNKGDKSKSKESGRKDSMEMTHRSPGLHNGDSVDSVQVGVTKNSTRVIVDNVDLAHQGKRVVDHDGNLGGDDKVSASPGGTTKHKSIGEYLVSGAKDLKGKLGHHRHSSGSSVNSDNYSTNLWPKFYN